MIKIPTSLLADACPDLMPILEHACIEILSPEDNPGLLKTTVTVYMPDLVRAFKASSHSRTFFRDWEEPRYWPAFLTVLVALESGTLPAIYRKTEEEDVKMMAEFLGAELTAQTEPDQKKGSKSQKATTKRKPQTVPQRN